VDDKPDDFTIQKQAVLLENERETAQSMTLLIGSVCGTSLMVGGVGILAIVPRDLGSSPGHAIRRRPIGRQLGAA
jgi:hypothetical protein